MSRTFNKIGRSSTGTEIPQTITYSDITLDKIDSGEYQKEGTLTAQIRQTVVTVSHYPTKQVDSNLQAGLFGSEEFGFESKPFTNTENRVAWLLIPANKTEQEVLAQLAILNKANACIYKILSNHPILDKNQQNAVNIGLGGVTLDTFANRQIVRYPTGGDHPQEGQICLDSNKKVQYRRTLLWNAPREDEDNRTVDAADVHISSETRLELSMVVPASTITMDMEGQEL